MLTSIDRRIDDVDRRTEAMRQFLTALKNAIAAMEQHIEINDGAKEFFSTVDTTKEVNGEEREIWIANANILWDVVQAFNKDDLSAYDEANKAR